MFSSKIISFLLLLLLADVLMSQEYKAEYPSDVTLNYSKTILAYSENVQDSFFIYIKLPGNYNKEPDKTYPAVFLLDGDIAFPMAWSVVRYLQYGRYVPDVIIIGIGYGGLLFSNSDNQRERDYSISPIERYEASGGAENFLDFLEKELIPMIREDYRIDTSSMTLSGHSLGGLLALYTYLSRPSLFNNFIVSSPYTSADVDELLDLEEQNIKLIEKTDNRLFISRGMNEDNDLYAEPIKKIVDRLLSHQNIQEKVKFRIFDEGEHFTTPSEALVYGMKFIFSGE